MILYPSIHIKDGTLARLTRGGDLEQAELLQERPYERAMQLEQQGFPWLHVVDLNGAFAGQPINNAAIEAILARVKSPIQLSGGLRAIESIENWLQKGIARVVLSTAAANDPELMREACRRFPDRIAVKIDSRNGFVATTGWTSTSSLKTLDLALRAEEAGAAAIIYADINRDGALADVDIESLTDLAFCLTIPVIAAGGVRTLDDLAQIRELAPTGVEGLILGYALYSGMIKSEDALRVATET
ncbi:MAG: HisA/HisF-related TIM barrel protein [Bdellovibrionales bacterium]